MCVRYVLRSGDLYDWIERIEKKRGQKTVRSVHEIIFHGSIFPGEAGAVATLDGNDLTIRPATWGLQPSWAKDASFGKKNAYNARAETLSERPTFRGPFKKRRCLVPAGEFYERTRIEGRLHWLKLIPRDGPFAIAGLWEPENDWTDSPTYTLATTVPNEVIGEVHDRMPVVLSPEDYEVWLDPAAPVEALRTLMVPCPPEWFKVEDAGPIKRPPQEESLF